MPDKISNARKRELEQPDPFLESLYKTLDTAKKIKKQLIFIAATMISLIMIVSITIYTIDSAEDKASLMLTDALKNYDTNKQKPIDGYNAVKAQFETLLNEYPNTSAGTIGNLRFAQICYAAGQYDMAYKFYKESLELFKNNPLIENIILTSLGYTCYAQKKYKDAEKYFQTISDNTLAFMKDDALFNLGMLSIANGENKKGLDFLKKLTSEYKNSPYIAIAEETIAKN